MTERTTHGFFLSATLHVLIVVAVWVLYMFNRPPAATPIFELVAGAGDNYMATEAPALGSPTSTKLDLPEVPPAPQPRPVEASPMTPAPRPAKVEAPKQIIPAKPPAAKAPATKAPADEPKKMTKAEFDRLNKQKKVANAKPRPAPAKVKKIDARGIASGVVGGSPMNTTGGAGGKALTAAETNEIDRYVALLQQRLKDQLDQTPGLEDGLHAEAELHIMADGRLTRAQIVKSSRNEEFDLAVLRAIRAVKMPPRPKGLEQYQVIPFSTRARE